MHLGGPVWHASVAGLRRALPHRVAERLARAELDGVGDATRGEWVERTPRAVHVRRRLSAPEQLLVGPVVDVRGTGEATQRYEACAPALNAFGLMLAHEELNR